MKHAEAFLKLVDDSMARIREMSIEEMLALREKKTPLRLVDVREDNEWAKGNIPGSEHMGRGIIERDIEAKIPEKDTLIVLYCGGGFRSALSADNLQKMGYTNVYSLAGGWREWNSRNPK